MGLYCIYYFEACFFSYNDMCHGHLPLSLHIDHLCHGVTVVTGYVCTIIYLSFPLLFNFWIVPSFPLFWTELH